MKKFVFILIAISLFLTTPTAEAKVLPQAQKSAKTILKSPNTSGIGASAALRADRRALFVSFSNLQNASLVSYLLTYQTSTQNEGAGGTLNLDGSTSQKEELLFGTCSKNVCTYHKGIQNAKLEVSYTTKSAKKYIKRFKIKV